MRLLYIKLILFTTLSLYSQDKKTYTISGYVYDLSSGESIIGALVSIKELGKGIMTNTYGFYSITISEGTYTLVSSYHGFKKYEKKINLDKNLRLDIYLEQFDVSLDEVVVSDRKSELDVRSYQMSVNKMSGSKVKR